MLAKAVDRLYVYDNSVDDDAQILCRLKGVKFIKRCVYDIWGINAPG